MGKHSIDRGNRDSWTITPKMVAAAGGGRAAPEPRPKAAGGGGGGFGGMSRRPAPADFDKFFRDPAKRDPRGYIIPADQPDFLTATKFVNTLIGTGLTVHRAKAEFTVGRQEVPGRVVRREVGPGVPRPPARHVRAAGPPGRLRRRLDDADAALRHGRVDARLPDGREVRPRARRLRRPVRGTEGRGAAAAGEGDGAGRVDGLLPRHADERLVPRREPAAGRGRGGAAAHAEFTVNGKEYPAGTFFVAARRRLERLLEKLATDLGTPFIGRLAGRRADIAPRSSRCASGCGTATAGRCPPAGRACSWSGSSSRSRSSTRRNSIAAGCRRCST